MIRAAVLMLVAASLVLGAAAPAHAETSTEVVQGDVLRLESTSDAAAMATMEPGRPVPWDVGVSASQPDGGIALLLAVEVSADVYAATVRSCAAPWTADGCADAPAPTLFAGPLIDGEVRLGTQAAADARWYRIEVELLQPVGGASAALELRAIGAGETVASSGGVVLPPTGTMVAPGGGLAVVAVGAGLALATLRRRIRRADAEGDR